MNDMDTAAAVTTAAHPHERTLTDVELALRLGHLYNPDNGEQYGKAEL